MFLRDLSLEVAEDRDTLRTLASEGGYGSSTVKNSAAHAAAKLVALELSAGNDASGLLEAFEFIALGILGKHSLWKALREANLERVSSSINFDHLIKRAETQQSAVEQYRLASVSEALCI